MPLTRRLLGKADSVSSERLDVVTQLRSLLEFEVARVGIHAFLEFANVRKRLFGRQTGRFAACCAKKPPCYARSSAEPTDC